jgi:hypothetical protein
MCPSTYCRANEGLLTLAQEGAMRGMGGAQREARSVDDVRREAQAGCAARDGSGVRHGIRRFHPSGSVQMYFNNRPVKPGPQTQ